MLNIPNAPGKKKEKKKEKEKKEVKLFWLPTMHDFY
jgi:hypothetical protein